MSVLDQVNAVALRHAMESMREDLIERAFESRFLREVKRQGVTVAFDTSNLLPSFRVMEGPAFPEYHAIRLQQRVYIHKLTGEGRRR